MNIHDHGENDPLEFHLGDTWRVVARISREAIEAQRVTQNQRDGESTAAHRCVSPVGGASLDAALTSTTTEVIP